MTMNLRKNLRSNFLLPTMLAAGLLGAPLYSMAQAMPEMAHHGEEHGPGPMPPPDLGMLPFGVEAAPPFLHGVKLSEEQEDKIFSILHAQAPLLREQMKALHKAQAALQSLSTSAQYDDGKAQGLANTAARAMAESELLRIRGMQKIRALLNAEQIKQFSDAREQMKACPPGDMHKPADFPASSGPARPMQ